MLTIAIYLGLNVLRRIGGQKKNILLNKENRPHLFADRVEYEPGLDGNTKPTVSTFNHEGLLKVTGFLRGKSLDVNGLVHIPGLGDFQMNQIDSPVDPNKLEKNEMKAIELKILAQVDPQKQTSLQSENIPDAMDAEQTWPTEEEIKESQKETKTKIIKRIPKGWSEYQAAWIPDTEVVKEESSDDDDDDGTVEDNDDEYMSCKESSDDELENSENDEERFTDASSISEAAVNDEMYDLQMDLVEERETMKKVKEARVDEMWPDEIDTPFDVAAKDRFQKYRGLESFRYVNILNFSLSHKKLVKYQNF